MTFDELMTNRANGLGYWPVRGSKWHSPRDFTNAQGHTLKQMRAWSAAFDARVARRQAAYQNRRAA